MRVVLVLALALPVAGLVALPALPRAYATRVGAATSAGVLVLVAAVAAGFDYGHPERVQDVVDVPWAPTLGLRFHVGLDGVSLPLLVLTALLALLCQLYGLKVLPKGGSPRAFTGLLLGLQVGMDGTFVALDLLLFFVFFETVLIPMWALIRWWGGDGAGGDGAGGGARVASTKFVLYTLLGSALMLVGFLVVYAHTGTLDMTALAARRGAGMSAGTQELAFGLIALGLAVKTPMWPLHTWLPDAHTAAPTVGSVLLAGVLLKMGTYGFVRIAVAELPLGAHHFAPALAAFAVAGIVYAALACLAQARAEHGDLKRLIAYSSVGHMGFVLLGIATLTPVGINGALFANVAHGLVTGLLFFLAGGLKERFGGTGFTQVGRGLYARAPRFGGLVVFAAVASLGLPGLAGFWGEVLAMYGAARPAAGLSRGGYAAMLAIAGVGVVLTAAYVLAVVRRVCMGEPRPAAGTLDLRRIELGSWLPLAALTLVAGLWPAMLLDVTNPAVHALLAVR